MRKCSRCKELLPPSSFHNNRSNKRGGKDNYCKPCASEMQKVYRARKAEDPDWPAKQRQHWRKHLLKSYGITEEIYESFMAWQGGECEGCGTSLNDNRDTQIDHCHETGIVRGILCHHCNRALGGAKDNPNTLLKLVDYLLHFQKDIGRS